MITAYADDMSHWEDWHLSPHMTIAEFITAERTSSLMEELAAVAPAGRFLCTHVSYAVPDNAMHFTERCRLTLGAQ